MEMDYDSLAKIEADIINEIGLHQKIDVDSKEEIGLPMKIGDNNLAKEIAKMRIEIYSNFQIGNKIIWSTKFSGEQGEAEILSVNAIEDYFIFEISSGKWINETDHYIKRI